MHPDVLPLIEESIDVSAPAESIWALLADLRRMARWSPQVMRIRVDGEGPVGIGTRTRNVNRAGLLVWTTRSQVVRFDPPRELAFRIRDNRAVWSFELIPYAAGTTVVHRREAPEGITDRAARLEDRFMGGVAPFQEKLRAGMRVTLRRLKEDAEAGQ